MINWRFYPIQGYIKSNPDRPRPKPFLLWTKPKKHQPKPYLSSKGPIPTYLDTNPILGDQSRRTLTQGAWSFLRSNPNWV